MSVVSWVLIAGTLVLWLCHVACGKKLVHSIKDCNQQTFGLTDCRYQGFQSMPYDVFDFLPGKSSIRLMGNPFVCDCRLAWFYRESEFKHRYVRKSVIKDVHEMKCNSPKKFKGVKLSDLREEKICPVTFKHLARFSCHEKPRERLLDCRYMEKGRLPDDLFDTKMKKINLWNAEYTCDCSIVWFLRKLKQRAYRKKIIKTSNIGKCASPKRLASKRIEDVTEDDVCPQLPRTEAINACEMYPPVCHLFASRCKKDKYAFKCIDIDECAEYSHNCHPSMKCINKSPYFKCECKPGYTGKWCDDINECSDKSRCGKNAKCVNHPGSYECVCNPGFKGKGKICFDINECLLKTSCSKDATCLNTHGSYECTCKPGFSGDGKKCEDIDECRDKSTCSVNADCSNSPGSYECKCREGFTGNGKNCTDINECSTKELNTCHEAAKCINTSPGYQCHCPSGYKSYNKGTLCEDVDECESKSYCSKQARCENNPGSFHCVCETGYSGNGKFCEDIDECENSMQCSANAKCENSIGSYKCTCNTGYYGNGKICKDIDECSKNEDICSLEYSKCVNNPGSYQCKCIDGFERNETHCTDIDECKSPRSCEENTVCFNYPEGYKCDCKEGYERFTDKGPCFKEEFDVPIYELLYVRIAALAVAVVVLLLMAFCCYKCCCGRKKESSGKKETKSDGSAQPLIYGGEYEGDYGSEYGGDMPYIPLKMSPIPPNISMVSAYSEKDFDEYDNIK